MLFGRLVYLIYSSLNRTTQLEKASVPVSLENLGDIFLFLVLLFLFRHYYMKMIILHLLCLHNQILCPVLLTTLNEAVQYWLSLHKIFELEGVFDSNQDIFQRQLRDRKRKMLHRFPKHKLCKVTLLKSIATKGPEKPLQQYCHHKLLL